MEMDDLMCRSFENAGIFILLAQVEVIDHGADIGMVHPMYHFHGFGSGVQDIAFLTAQRLDGDDDFVAAGNLSRHLKKFGNLLLRSFTRKPLGYLARAGASPNHDGSAEFPTT